MRSIIRNAGMLVCLLPVCCFLCMCSGETIRIPGRYYHDEMEFSIEFPDEWEIKEGDGVVSSLVEAVSPWDGEEDAFSEYIAVDVERLSEKIDLDELFEVMREEQAQEFPYFKERDHGDMKIDGNDAKYMLFDIGMEEGQNRVMSYTLIKGKKGYLISCVAESSAHERYKQIFEAAAASFRFE